MALKRMFLFLKSGNLIVTAQYASQIVKISPAVILTIIAGNTDVKGGYVNGTGTSAEFYYPSDVKADAAGNIIVADYINNAIRKISPDGVVTTLAGTQAGPGAQEKPYLFVEPTGLAIGAGGVIYVADVGFNQIQILMPDGTVSLGAGSLTGASGDVDRVGSGTRFYDPGYIYTANAGTGYISDFINQKIKKKVLTGYTFKGNLPPGLTFDYKAGIISGVPTRPMSATTFTITGFNTKGFSTQHNHSS